MVYEVIEDILPFVLNTKWPLSNIWLLSYKKNYETYNNERKEQVFASNSKFQKKNIQIVSNI